MTFKRFKKKPEYDHQEKPYELIYRYGSYYLHMLMNIDKMYPGMKKYIQLGGISAQGQTRHDLRTATDQRGEQTINKDAKTSGKYHKFIKFL